MFGYIRFILAIFVVLSHVGVSFYGKNLGVFAVIVFYILAGYVTSKILLKVSPNNIRYFIVDRFLRIYPTFFVVSVITLVFLWITNFNNFLIDFYKLFLNFVILPLNYFYCIDVSIIDNPVGINFILPPAWSLGAEIQAYILLVCAILHKRVGKILAYISLVVFIFAHLGFIDSNIFGYRLVCGVFFIFYTGYLIYVKNYKDITLFCSIIFVAFIYIAYKHNYQIFTIETFSGYLFGVTIIILHEFYKPKMQLNSFLGSMSYIVFLNHYPSIWICKYVFGNEFIVYVFIISLVWAFVLYLAIEKPIARYRLAK